MMDALSHLYGCYMQIRVLVLSLSMFISEVYFVCIFIRSCSFAPCSEMMGANNFARTIMSQNALPFIEKTTTEGARLFKLKSDHTSVPHSVTKLCQQLTAGANPPDRTLTAAIKMPRASTSTSTRPTAAFGSSPPSVLKRNRVFSRTLFGFVRSNFIFTLVPWVIGLSSSKSSLCAQPSLRSTNEPLPVVPTKKAGKWCEPS